MWSQESEKNIMIVGHRGLRSLYPENTMVSFQAALDLKLDLIEFDVHFTKDKQLVVCHDTTIDRTTNGTGAIRDYTLEELKTFDAGIVKSEKFAGQRIPTLEEVLTLVNNTDYDVLLNVEIKDYDHEVIDATIAMLKQFGLDQRSVIACFNAEVIGYVQETYPEMRTQGFPARYMKAGVDGNYAITDQLYEKMFGIGIPIQKDNEELMAEDVAMAKKFDIRPWLFSADDREGAVKAVKAGATNITCNHPLEAVRYLVECGLHKPVERLEEIVAAGVEPQ